MMVDDSLVRAGIGVGVFIGAFLVMFFYVYIFLILYSNKVNRMNKFIVEIGYSQEYEEKEAERRRERKSAWRRWLDV